MQTASTLAVALLIFAAAENACQQRQSESAEKAGSAQATPAPTAAADAGTRDDPFADVPRITVGELRRAMDEGRAVVVDVRPEEAYLAGHIAGAVSIPEEEVTGRAGELPPDKLVVTYCA